MKGEIHLQFLPGQAHEGGELRIKGDVREVIERGKDPYAGKLGNPGDEYKFQALIIGFYFIIKTSHEVTGLFRQFMVIGQFPLDQTIMWEENRTSRLLDRSFGRRKKRIQFPADPFFFSAGDHGYFFDQ